MTDPQHPLMADIFAWHLLMTDNLLEKWVALENLCTKSDHVSDFEPP